ncbi:hypothetical protein DD238_001778 [Peronospora effusa]|uniref:Ion transport domain-containing protein n=1 Tax=Peronospora effusa TaxID=542832 RepID=A0A3M6VHV3_9STRA|nr:hypothetical protein DD238_001778 [Peronospora effusa]RQM14178.1 hypothetical protein DD237_003486 [Peronospora effusa]
MKAPKSYAKLSGATAPHIGCKEHVMTVASRLYFSSLYRIVYFFMIASSLVCVVWNSKTVDRMTKHDECLLLFILLSPSSMVFISLEIIVSTLLVLEVLLRMMAFKRRFWHKWCNIFDVVALVMSLVSVAMYFNEEGVLGELEEVAADSVLALRNAVQYARLAIFLKNRSDRPTTIGKEIDFEELAANPDDERELMLNAESGMALESDDEEEIQIV